MQLSFEKTLIFCFLCFAFVSTVSNSASNLLGGVLFILILWRWYKVRSLSVPRPLLLIMGMYIASLVIPAALSPTPLESFDTVYGYVKSMIFFFAAFMIPWTDRRWNICIALLALGLFANDLLAIWQWGVGGYLRPVGFAKAAEGMISGYFLFFIPFFFILALDDESISTPLRICLWCLLPVSLFVLFLNGVRMVMIIIFLAIVFIGLRKAYKSRDGRQKKLVAGALILFVVTGLVGASVSKRQDTILVAINKPASFLYERRILWDVAYRMFKESPLYGIGPGNYRENKNVLIEAHHDPKTVDMKISHAHNIEFQVLAEQGIIGFLGVLVFFVGLIRVIMWWHLHSLQKHLFLIAGVLLSVLFLAGQSDYTLGYKPVMRVFWTLMGLAFSRSLRGDDDRGIQEI